MAVLGMIVVVWPVEVGGHHRDVVGAVLAIEIFAILQTADFGEGVSLVGFLQFGGQQARFGHRLRRHAGIDARRAEKFQLFATVFPRRVNHVHLQNHVFIHKVGQCRLVSHYAAHFGSGEKHIFGLFLGEEALHVILASEVELAMRAGYNVVIALAMQFAHNGRSHHAAMPCNVDFRIFFHHFTIPFSRYSARLVRITPATWSAATFCIS